MKVSNPIRTVFALLVIGCVLAMLLVPGATSAMLVQTSGGKQVVRVVNLGVLALLALFLSRGIIRSTSLLLYPHRQVYVHGFGPDLLDKTCARLC